MIQVSIAMNVLEQMRLIPLPRYRKMLRSYAWMRFLLNVPEGLRRAMFGGKAHYCTVCESSLRKFLRFGHSPKEWCPVCTSFRRHRAAWLFFHQRTNLFDGSPKTMLHVAPELAFESRLKKVRELSYITADCRPNRAKLCMNIASIPCPDNVFEVIFCSHVLEHVPDDHQAMCEFARVLKPHGWALFMVPYRANRLTDEDLSVTDPAERERRFGQYNHVRFYGRDFVDRLQDAGFRVTIIQTLEIVGPDQLNRLGMNAKEALFYCEKASM